MRAGSARSWKSARFGGYSTIWLARALPAGGRLVTLEAEPKYTEVARANIARAGLADVVKHAGAGAGELARLAAEGRGPFDLIFIDADKQNHPGYLAWALTPSRCGSLIVADNVVRDGAVTDASSDDLGAGPCAAFSDCSPPSRASARRRSRPSVEKGTMVLRSRSSRRTPSLDFGSLRSLDRTGYNRR